ncbi:MAG: ArnT family glycosyltransferase [Phycisphaerae bacterium]
MTTSAKRSRLPAWPAYLLAGVLAAVVLFYRLGTEVMDNHECRAALTARTMVRGDVWIRGGEVEGTEYSIPPDTPVNRVLVPVENGRPRLVKTPLGYWCIAAASLPAGEVTEFTARVPSALAGVLTVLIVLAIGRKLVSPRAALFGAVMLATSYGFHRWFRNARPEALLTLCMTAAMACFHLGLTEQRPRRRLGWMAGFWVAMGLANLAKPFVPLLLGWPLLAFMCWRQASRRGDEYALRLLRRFLAASLVGVVVVSAVSAVGQLQWWRLVGVGQQAGYYTTFAVCVLGPMFWLLVRSRGWRPVGKLLPTALPGMAVMLLMFVPWMAYMARLFPALAGDIFSGQVTERTAAVGGWEVNRPWLYAESVATYAFLWLPFVPVAVARVMSRRLSRDRPGRVYLLLWAAGLALLFTAAAGKRDHYILPALPPLFLLCGAYADDLLARVPRGRAVRFLGWLYPLLAVGAVVSFVVLVGRSPSWQNAHLLLVVAVAAVPAVFIGVFVLRGREYALIPLVAATAVVVYVTHAAGTELWDPRRPLKAFARHAGHAIEPEETVYHWNAPPPMLAFYFGRQLPAVQWEFAHLRSQEARRSVRQWLESPDSPQWMFSYEQDSPFLQRLGYREILRSGAAEGGRHIWVLHQRDSDTQGYGSR